MLLCAVAVLVLVVAGRAGAALLPLAAERLRASVGGYAVMNCHLDFPFGNEIPYHLQWDKDGETIFSWYSGEGGGAPRVAARWGGRVRLVGGAPAPLGRGSINVTAVRDTDAGLYRCRVAFPNRSPPERNNGTFYYLDVDGGNLIATPPVNVTVVEGERAELECAPRSPEAEVEWLRDGAPLAALPELAARAERPRNGSLVLRQALSHDAGEYSCRVRAPPAPDQTTSAFLDVQYKAKVVYAPKERYLPYGKPASLDCHFSANPPLTNLRWEKDGFLFDPYNVPGVFYSRNGSLLFNQVDESHEGQYSCTAYNALGTEGPSPGVRVRVQRPPALAARPRPLYLTRLGAALTLPCTAALDPHHTEPAVHWTKKDGTPLPEGRYSLSGGNLTLSDVSEEDRGVYVCTATNEAAAVSAETELLIENVPPRAPYNLTAAPAPAPPASVHLTWVPGHNDLDTEYNVWYRERAASEWRTMKILSRGVTEGTLVGLRPNAEYEVRVLAQDQLGDGLFSKPVFVRTPDVEMAEDGETAYAAAITEGGPVSVAGVDEERAWGALNGEGEGELEGEGEEDEAGGALRVSVRLLDEGALVRWQRAPGDSGRCELRWSARPEGGAPAVERLLHSATTDRDYILVTPVEEGVRYVARVRCGGAGGAGGAAALQVPRWGRLRAAALGSAAAALLLAALATAVYFLRHRLFPHNSAESRRDKRRY